MTDTTEPQSPAAAIDFTLAEVTAADWLNRGELHYAAAARQHTSGAVPIEYTAQEIALGRLAIEISAGVQLAVQDTAAGDRAPTGSARPPTTTRPRPAARRGRVPQRVRRPGDRPGDARAGALRRDLTSTSSTPGAADSLPATRPPRAPSPATPRQEKHRGIRKTGSTASSPPPPRATRPCASCTACTASGWSAPSCTPPTTA
ncbi:hypothetical protein GXW82_44465 [Streptacidiphilus sp. 4-A2]|nr:hypothetical protein [Streptacidiphilus sp. 4-A2]